MKLFLLAITIGIYLPLAAQTKKSQSDSLLYYQKQLRNITKEYLDSLKHQSNYITAKSNVIRLLRSSDDYFAFTISFGLASANFDKLNADNSLTGFSEVSGLTPSFSYGFSTKRNRRIVNFTMIGLSTFKKSTRSNETIKTSFSTFLQLEFGYDLLTSNKINLYPYAGLGFKNTSLEYNGPITSNPSYTNISNMIQNSTSTKDNIVELGYQVGLGIEVQVTNRSPLGGVFLFAKGGTNQPFSRKSFDFGGTKYDPKLNYGALDISLGIKLFSR